MVKMKEDKIKEQADLSACVAFNSHDRGWSPEMKDLEKMFEDGAHYALTNQWVDLQKNTPMENC